MYKRFTKTSRTAKEKDQCDCFSNGDLMLENRPAPCRELLWKYFSADENIKYKESKNKTEHGVKIFCIFTQLYISNHASLWLFVDLNAL